MNLRSGFSLGKWTVLPLENRIFDSGQSRRVQPKSMDVLLCLAEAGGEVVERESVLDKVWAGRAVSDEPLTRCIGELRRAFGDSRANPDYILTIPKRGYRLLKVAGPIEAARAEPARESAKRPLLLRIFDVVRRPTVALSLIVLAVLVEMVVERVIEYTAEGESDVVVSTAEADRSIAVLPFVDMSAEQDQEYMGDGIAEEVLNLLTSIRDLRVISRSSSFSLKGTQVDMRSVAKQFGVAYILEGSVRTSGNRIRVTAQLVDGRTDTHVWSDSFERDLDDIFAIQDEIAQAVVPKLRVTLLGNPPRSRATDTDAYALFLQGRYLHEQTGGDSMVQALDYYKAALEIDPDYVPALVWIAALYDDTKHSIGIPYDEVGRLAREAIDRALAIAPGNALALGMSAILKADWDDDLAGAAAQMQAALDADPSNPYVLRWSAIVMTNLGQHDAAVLVNEYLFERDPIGNISKINLAATYLNAGRFDEAVRLCEIEVALSDGDSPCGSRLIVAYLHTGKPQLARDLLRRVDSPRVAARLAPMVHSALGEEAEYEQAIDALIRRYEDGDRAIGYWVAHTYLYRGDETAMFAWLERLRRDDAFTVTPNMAYFESYAEDSRWLALMSATGRAPGELGAMQLDLPPLD
jgi:TolB-like protein/DNA-binding winged helix-turn-helix (wHTH) protein